MTNFVCLKLTTKETLFAELSESVKESYVVLHPMILMPNSENSGMYLTQWVPYVDDITFTIPKNLVYFCGKLKTAFVNFYGVSRIKEEIAHINKRGFPRVEDGENDNEVTNEVLTEMRDLCDSYAYKFGLDGEELKSSLALNDSPKVLH